MVSQLEHWPDLPLAEWADTCATLHLWTQVVGKIRLAHAPLINHWWQVPLYVTSRGLTTSAMAYGSRSFQLDFDFLEHNLIIQTSDGATAKIALAPRTVADFYAEVMSRLGELGLETRVWTIRTETTHPMTRNTLSDSGAFSCRRIASARSSGHGFLAR
jgi:Family of unknown function (DUF5996)